MHSLLATILAMALILNPEVFVFYCIVMNSLFLFLLCCCADVQHLFVWNMEYLYSTPYAHK